MRNGRFFEYIFSYALPALPAPLPPEADVYDVYIVGRPARILRIRVPSGREYGTIQESAAGQAGAPKKESLE